MAKNLLLRVLLDNLGSYVEPESLSADNLKLGVFSGKVELANLRLRRHALRSLSGSTVIALVLIEHTYVQSIYVSVVP
jgi:hypothetical protein